MFSLACLQAKTAEKPKTSLFYYFLNQKPFCPFLERKKINNFYFRILFFAIVLVIFENKNFTTRATLRRAGEIADILKLNVLRWKNFICTGDPEVRTLTTRPPHLLRSENLVLLTFGLNGLTDSE